MFSKLSLTEGGGPEAKLRSISGQFLFFPNILLLFLSEIFHPKTVELQRITGISICVCFCECVWGGWGLISGSLRTHR